MIIGGLSIINEISTNGKNVLPPSPLVDPC